MMNAVSTFFRKLSSFFSILCGAALVSILCLLTVFQGKLSFVFQSGALFSNIALFLLATAAVALCVIIHMALPRRTKIPTKRGFPMPLAFGLAHLLLFSAQWMLVRSLWFYPGWDAMAIREAADELARGVAISSPEYFQTYPNNAPLAMLLSLPYWIGLQLGMAEPYVLLPICGAACINLSCMLGTICAFRLTKSRLCTIFCFGLSTVFILLSPYVSVAYGDAYAILFPVLSLFLYLTSLKSPFKWFLIALLSGIGSTIKPTVLIFLIALVLFAAIRNLAALPWQRKQIKRLTLIGMVFLVGLVPRFEIQAAANLKLAGSANPQSQMTISHFLMMGLNQQTYGGNSPEDVAFSKSFSSAAERKSAEYHKAYERLTSMSLPASVRFFSAKLYKAFGSGTFEWNGSFLINEAPRRTDALSGFLRSIYYRRGTYNGAYITVYQALWLFILALGACGFFLGRKNWPLLTLLGLPILGLAGYQMVFESWPRYLFLYSPFFVILATLGLRSLCERIKKSFPRAAVKD